MARYNPPRNLRKRDPKNFLEGHALEALRAEPTWTVDMYAVYNDLTDETTEELRAFLQLWLPEEQTQKRTAPIRAMRVREEEM